MRRALQIVAVFECAGLALIAVDGQITGAFIGTHKTPFGARRETRTTKAAQTGLFDLLLHLFPVAVRA